MVFEFGREQGWLRERIGKKNYGIRGVRKIGDFQKWWSSYLAGAAERENGCEIQGYFGIYNVFLILYFSIPNFPRSIYLVIYYFIIFTLFDFLFSKQLNFFIKIIKKDG